MRLALGVVRAAIAIALVAAVGAQLEHSIRFWQAQPGADIPFLVVGYFSYFTIESALVAAIVLAIGAVLLASGRRDPAWFAVARAAVTTYVVITGVVYNVLLRPIESGDGSSLWWSNEVLHVVAPIWLALDWLIAPGRRVPWSTLWLVVVFPLAWCAYTLLRGPVALDSRFGTNWYPYPFLNPDTSAGGYGEVAAYVVGIAIGILAVGSLVVLSSRRHPVGAATTGRITRER